MADAPYTPSLDELLTGDKYIGDRRWRALTEDEIRRGIASHVADEVERLAEDVAQMENGWVSREWGSVVNKLDVMNLLRARAAELRKEQ